MNAKSVISAADSIRPNLVESYVKYRWLSMAEKQIESMMCMYGEREPQTGGVLTAESQMLLGSEYTDMYAYYVVAMIDLANQNITMYNNSVAMFETLYDSWRKKWRRENQPKKNTHIKTGGGDIT